MFTDNEILLDRVPCFYFYYTLTTTTNIMFSIITNHKTVDDTEKICKKFQALHFESNKHNFQNHVYQCNAPCLNLRRCNVFFKQHTLANVGNTRHLFLLILYSQPKKKLQEIIMKIVIVTTEIQTVALSFTIVQYAAVTRVRNSLIPHFLFDIVNNCSLITTISPYA